mgnify:CR=1 FL=1
MHVRILLVRPRNPENIGAAARAAMNFGITDFSVVNPYPPVWRETRAAAGAASLLKRAKNYPTVAKAVEDCELVIGTTAGTRRKLDLPSFYLPALGARMKKVFPSGSGRAAILFGSEKSGLSNEELADCRWIMTLPTSPDCSSMNLGQAVAVVCYELARKQERPLTPLTSKAPPPMSAEQVERLVELADTVLLKTGFMNSWAPALRRAQIRRMFLRWDIKSPDEFLLNGAFRWTLKKLK